MNSGCLYSALSLVNGIGIGSAFRLCSLVWLNSFLFSFVSKYSLCVGCLIDWLAGRWLGVHGVCL